VDFLDPAYLAVFEAHLDAMGMPGRIGQEIGYQSLGQGAATLVFFQDNGNPLPWLYVRSKSSVFHYIHHYSGGERIVKKPPPDTEAENVVK